MFYVRVIYCEMDNEAGIRYIRRDDRGYLSIVKSKNQAHTFDLQDALEIAEKAKTYNFYKDIVDEYGLANVALEDC